MLSRSLGVLSASLLSAALCAQGYLGEKPAIIKAAAKDTNLGAAKFGGAPYQVLFVPHASLPANTYVVALTLPGTTAGSYKLETGTYNFTTNTYTKNTWADALNVSGQEFALGISDDLLVAVWDRGSGLAPGFARRANLTANFAPGGAVSGGPTGYVDSNLARINGKLAFLHIQGSDINVGDLDANTGALSNIRRAVTNPIGAGSHSPTPVNDSQGNTYSLMFSAQVPARQSNAWFASSVQDAAPAFEMVDSPTWLANGDANAGDMVNAEAAGSYGDCLRWGVLAMSSAVVPATGGTLNLSLVAPERPATQPPYIGLVLVGALNSSGIPIPTVNGNLSINPLSLVALPSAAFTPAGFLKFTFGTPPLAPNTVVHAQPVLFDAAGAPGSQVYLGNTSYIVAQ